MTPPKSVTCGSYNNACPVPDSKKVRATGEQVASPSVYGGRTWLLPAKLPRCMPSGYCFSLKDLRETKRSREAERLEGQRIQADARRGDVRAMAQMGFMLLNGIMMPKDEAAAMGWFYEAAIRGEVVSMFALGCAFRDGVGVAADPKISRFWLGRARASGYTTQC
jgi:TPR repeat protein